MSKLTAWLGLDKRQQILDPVNDLVEKWLSNSPPEVQKAVKALGDLGNGRITAEDVGKVIYTLVPNAKEEIVTLVANLLAKQHLSSFIIDEVTTSLRVELTKFGL